MDGFQLTHMVEPFEMPDQAEVDKFLPPYVPHATLHPDKPVTMGALGMPEIFNEAMKAKDAALVNSKKVILEVWKEWEKIFGRKYEPVSSYRTEDAKVVLLTMGSMGETAEMAVDELRRKGRPVGLLKLKLWRPFPFAELKKAVKGAKVLAVLDRAVSFGGPGGPVGAEIRSALYGEPDRPVVMDYIIGLGGRDMTVEDFIAIAEKASQDEKRKTKELYEIYGVRGQ
jgi:pyruvate ferredoxin oxidoreductase alpha subunit